MLFRCAEENGGMLELAQMQLARSCGTAFPKPFSFCRTNLSRFLINQVLNSLPSAADHYFRRDARTRVPELWI
jgi:hypothetical protein